MKGKRGRRLVKQRVERVDRGLCSLLRDRRHAKNAHPMSLEHHEAIAGSQSGSQPGARDADNLESSLPDNVGPSCLIRDGGFPDRMVVHETDDSSFLRQANSGICQVFILSFVIKRRLSEMYRLLLR